MVHETAHCCYVCSARKSLSPCQSRRGVAPSSYYQKPFVLSAAPLSARNFHPPHWQKSGGPVHQSYDEPASVPVQYCAVSRRNRQQRPIQKSSNPLIQQYLPGTSLDDGW